MSVAAWRFAMTVSMHINDVTSYPDGQSLSPSLFPVLSPTFGTYRPAADSSRLFNPVEPVPKSCETVEKLAKSGEVWVSEGFSREFAFACLAPYQWLSRFIRAAQ